MRDELKNKHNKISKKKQKWIKSDNINIHLCSSSKTLAHLGVYFSCNYILVHIFTTEQIQPSQMLITLSWQNWCHKHVYSLQDAISKLQLCKIQTKTASPSVSVCACTHEAFQIFIFRLTSDIWQEFKFFTQMKNIFFCCYANSHSHPYYVNYKLANYRMRINKLKIRFSSSSPCLFKKFDCKKHNTGFNKLKQN